MADHFLPGLENFKQSLSLADIDPNIEFINHFPGINPTHQQPSGLNIHSLMEIPVENFLPHLPESPGYTENFPGFFVHENNTLGEQIISSDNDHVDRKRNAMEISNVGDDHANSSPQVSDNGVRKRSGAVRRGKKVKGNEKKEAKPTEVVHVRAKRGQATDSHSLAERVRREKINERLRCLQDIVPGCHKTMGMAVMLDEIINYVQSLQNQVEFLSMKLTAASTFYDFNSETDAMEAIQRAKAFEALKIQNGASPGLPSAHFAPAGLNSEFYPQFPQNR